ncbi:MAG: M20/M25/M40 family metallo-hydrolase [Actinobacteria bacterium]|nr:M20/M25/M40 family metallo-hydrolase [Actinomycetota bacterium]
MSTETTAVPIDVERCQQLLQEMVRLRSVVGEDTTAHEWVSARLCELGFEVKTYAVEGRRTPLVLGVLEGDGDGPGIMLDAHYDTVHARPSDWSRDPWGGEVEDGVLYGRGAVDSKGTHVAMLAGVEGLVNSGATRNGPIYFMSDSDGEDGFRGAVLMADLGVAARIDTIFSAEATSNEGIEIAYPGISTWKVTAIGRTAHPTEPEQGINAITLLSDLVQAVDAGRLETPRGNSDWFEPRVTLQACRTPTGGGWTIPGRCDVIISVMSPAGVTLPEVQSSIERFAAELADEHEEGVRFEVKVLPMGAGRLWLRPGESDLQHRAVKAMEEAVAGVRGSAGEVRKFNGGWVDAVELMRAGDDGFGNPAVITFGPGHFDQAHTVDEHISLDEVREAAAIYMETMRALLG